VAAVERALIQPPDNDYDGFNVMIHGIEPGMTEDSPTFTALWPLLLSRISGKPVIAHNASFDFSVLRHCLDSAGIEYPELDYYCTRVFSLRQWPQLPSYALELVADRCAIDFGHHDPGEDARACAEIALLIAKECEASGLQEIADLYEVRTGKLRPGGYCACSYRRPRPGGRGYAWSPKDLRAECEQFDETHPFFDAEVVFTGVLESMQRKEAMQRIVNVGGRPASGVTTTTDYLVIGDVDLRRLRAGEHLTSKMKRAMQLREAGGTIQIVGESDFLQLL
jgi:DNA polymerase-3 subunit epsilon